MYNLTQFIEENDETVRNELVRIANIRKQYAVHRRNNLDFEANYRKSSKIIHKYRRYLNEHVLWLQRNIPLPNITKRAARKRLGGIVTLLRDMFQMFDQLCNHADQLSPNFNLCKGTIIRLRYLKSAVLGIMDTLGDVAKLRRLRNIQHFANEKRVRCETVLEKLDRSLTLGLEY